MHVCRVDHTEVLQVTVLRMIRDEDKFSFAIFKAQFAFLY